MSILIVIHSSDAVTLLSSVLVAGVLAMIARQEERVAALTARVVALETKAKETKP